MIVEKCDFCGKLEEIKDTTNLYEVHGNTCNIDLGEFYIQGSSDAIPIQGKAILRPKQSNYHLCQDCGQDVLGDLLVQLIISKTIDFQLSVAKRLLGEFQSEDVDSIVQKITGLKEFDVQEVFDFYHSRSQTTE